MRKVKIRVPEGLNDIKLSQYQKFLRVTDGLDNDLLIKKRMIAVFCDITDTIVNSMSQKSFDDVSNTLINILGFDNDIDLQNTIRFNDVDYGFIPNIDDITVGEVADIDSFISDWQKMHFVMGVLYRPIKSKYKDKYTIEDYEAKKNGLDLPLDVVLGAYFF